MPLVASRQNTRNLSTVNKESKQKLSLYEATQNAVRMTQLGCAEMVTFFKNVNNFEFQQKPKGNHFFSVFVGNHK